MNIIYVFMTLYGDDKQVREMPQLFRPFYEIVHPVELRETQTSVKVKKDSVMGIEKCFSQD